MQETFKWQSANCVWAQLVSQYASAPVSNFPSGLEFGQRLRSCFQLDVSLAPALSQYFTTLFVRSSWCYLK